MKIFFSIGLSLFSFYPVLLRVPDEQSLFILFCELQMLSAPTFGGSFPNYEIHIQGLPESTGTH